MTPIPRNTVLPSVDNFFICGYFSFSLSGELLRPILPVYSKKDKRPELSAVAFDSRGNIYAADKANHRIQKFTFEGNFLCFIGGFHDLHCPMGIVVKKNGDVIVTEYENHCIKIFSQENLGKSTVIGAVGVGLGKFACPRGVALDHNENILVAESQNHRIQVVSSTGEPLGTFGIIGSDPGCLDTPYDVAMDTTGNIIVADAKNHRLQVFTRLVPVYAECAMHDEEYEAAIENGDPIAELAIDEDKISDLDEKAQPDGKDAIIEPETDTSLIRTDEQENNDRDKQGASQTDHLEVVEEKKNPRNVDSEILVESKQSSVENQEVDLNNNMMTRAST